MIQIIKQLVSRKIWVFIPLAFLVLIPLHSAEAAWWPSMDSMVKTLAQWIYYGFVGFGTLILSMGSAFLDRAIFYLIVDMGSWFRDPGGLGGAVSLGWQLTRDLLNMVFIFGLIFIGIKTILNSEDSGTRRQLGYLIAAALLINFSLYITQLVVDLSNLIAAQFYKLIVGAGSPPGTATGNAANQVVAEVSPIAAKYLDAVSLTSIFSQEALNDNMTFWTILLLGFFVFIMFSAAGFFFFFGSIMVIGRFIALIMYMIFSPVMFLGWILPYFRNISSKWWQGFFKQAFFGPLYVFLIYISIKVLEGLMTNFTTKFGDSSNSISKGLTGDGKMDVGFITMFMSFAIMIGLLWASLKVGENLSVTGGKMAMSGFSSARGLVYRNTAGRLSNRAIMGYDYLNNKTGGAIGNWGGERARQLAVKSRNYGAGGQGLQATQDESAKRGSANTSRVIADKRVADVRKGQAQAIGDLTDKQLLDGLKDGKTSAGLKANAHLLKSSQIDAIKKSDLDDKTKEEILGANKTRLKDKAKTKEGAKEIYEQHKKDLTKLPADVLTSEEFAEHIKDTATLSKIARMDGLTPDERKKIKDNVLNKSSGNVTTINDFFDYDREGKKFSG